MSNSSIACPHCGAENFTPGAFCESCGKALPSASASGPRIVTDADATTSAGQTLVRKSLEKDMKKAFTALMVVAVLQTIFGPIMLFAQKKALEVQNPGMEFRIEPWAYGVVFGIAIAFWILAIWSRKAPLPASIVGLVLFVTLHLIEAVADPTTIAKGLLVKIIVVVVLSQAIQASLKHRQTMNAQVVVP